MLGLDPSVLIIKPERKQPLFSVIIKPERKPAFSFVILVPERKPRNRHGDPGSKEASLFNLDIRVKPEYDGKGNRLNPRARE